MKKRRDEISVVRCRLNAIAIVTDKISFSFFAASRPGMYDGMPAHFADTPQLEAIYKTLSVTQPPPAPEVIAKMYRPASVVDKTHINGR